MTVTVRTPVLSTRPIECDVGKLKNDHVDLQQPSRDNKYRLLIIFLMKINRERCSNLVSELNVLYSFNQECFHLCFFVGTDMMWSDFYWLNRIRGWGLYRMWAWHPQNFSGELRAPSLQIPPSNNPRSATVYYILCWKYKHLAGGI